MTILLYWLGEWLYASNMQNKCIYTCLNVNKACKVSEQEGEVSYETAMHLLSQIWLTLYVIGLKRH